MLGPYNTIVFPHYYCHCIRYYYCCVHVIPIWFSLCPIEAHVIIVVPLYYYFYLDSDYIVTPYTPIYRK